MQSLQRTSLVLMRISLGWIFFYAGISKILLGSWSAGGFLMQATTFESLFKSLAVPGVVEWVSILNEWGLLLLGVSLLLGAFVRASSVCGAALMILYYFAHLHGVRPDANSVIVDFHIVYALLLIYFVAVRAGEVGGLDKIFARKPGVKKLV